MMPSARIAATVPALLAAAWLALAAASPATAAWVAGPRFSIQQSLYVVNTVSGKVSFCYSDGQGKPVCSDAGTFTNPTGNINVQSDPAGGVAWIHDRSTGRIMRCQLKAGSGAVLTGATCAMVQDTPLP